MTEVLDAIRSYAGDSTFMISLRDQLIARGTLSDRQIAAATRNLAPRVPNMGGFDAIVTLLSRAETNLKAPKLHFVIGDVAYVMRLKTARSQHAGSVDIVSRERVYNERFGAYAPVWFGRIGKDGNATFAANATPELVDVLGKFAANPREAVIEYGRKTGECSFCGRFLSTPESVTVGYGPICADRYGLEWGTVAEYSNI